jgi:hypothetical protein
MDNKLLSIGQTAKLLGASIDTLRRWDKSGKLKPFRPSQSTHRYYKTADLDLFLNDLEIITKGWATTENPYNPPEDYYCQSRDIFEGRLIKLQNILAKDLTLQKIFSLIVSIAGEIGNNSFDHNLGAWPDIPGIFFGYDLPRKKIVLADRGQGILKTLQRVRASLQKDEEALKVAFSEILSGRAPEARGNGLKFVKKVITENPLTLLFQSGNAELFIQEHEKKLETKILPASFHGCIAIINY